MGIDRDINRKIVMARDTIYYDKSQVDDVVSKISFILNYLGKDHDTPLDQWGDCIWDFWGYPIPCVIYEDDNIYIMHRPKFSQYRILTKTSKEYIQVLNYVNSTGEVLSFRPGKWQLYLDKIADKADKQCVRECEQPTKTPKQFRPI